VFVNREDELAQLERWWTARGAGLALVWGRRRVGKTALLERFSSVRPSVFHTAAARPGADELRLLSRAARGVGGLGSRDLEQRPFADWDDALDSLAQAASHRKLLLVIDEFPELVRVAPQLPGVIRAFWDRARGQTKLRILLCGSAVRTMQATQEERAPLYGRFDLALLVHPFRPHEAAAMLPGMAPADRALVWGLVGGVPLYLEWWQSHASIQENVARLACSPGGQLLAEGQLVLATEGDLGDLGRLTLKAIAAGRTRHSEIAQAVGAEPARVLERLVELQLVERLVPAGESPSRTRRRTYRIADNFLSFWLGVLDPHRSAIERGLGRSILPVLLRELDDHMSERWEAAFRSHLMRMAGEGLLGEDIVEIGRWWRDAPAVEVDAVALAGRRREAVLAGEAKWARRVDARRELRALAKKSEALPRRAEEMRYAVCAREAVEHAGEALAITAAEVFGA